MLSYLDNYSVLPKMISFKRAFSDTIKTDTLQTGGQTLDIDTALADTLTLIKPDLGHQIKHLTSTNIAKMQTKTAEELTH